MTFSCSPAKIVLALLAALVLPCTYLAARSQRDAAQLNDLLSQSRIGEARTLARGPFFRGAPGALVTEIERSVADLETRVAKPLIAQSTPRERLDRARHLAMLGRYEAAQETLASVNDPAAAPEAAALFATMCEHQRQWDAALGAYTTAREAWGLQPDSPARTVGLQQATQGMAYAQRKLGQYGLAAATYGELLTAAPTAETHFLLAQFYEDAQDAARAQFHARQAMTLAPQTYQAAGQTLINKLLTYHFGCFGAARTELAGGAR